MTAAVLDTTVIIHLFRKNQTALSWFAAQSVGLSITPITWMEVMVGAANKHAQTDLLQLLNGFDMAYLTNRDMDWAMKQMLAHRFSGGVGIMDCFNAAVCYGLNVPIYTHNQKYFLKILPSSLVIKPY